MTTNYYLITKGGLLDVSTLLRKESRELVLANLRNLTDDSYGKLGPHNVRVALVDEETLAAMSPDTISGFGRFFSRHGVARSFLIEWTEDGERHHHVIGNGRLVFYEEALGPLPRESVLAVRDDLTRVCDGGESGKGSGRILYLPLRTLNDRPDMMSAAKRVFNTVMSDMAYEMIGVLEWTGEPLNEHLRAK